MQDFIFDRFPYPWEIARLQRYRVNDLLLRGEHYEAFNIAAPDNFSRKFEELRYIVVNFNGLVAKVNSDMLFGEEVQIRADKNQTWLEDLYKKNKLKVQFLESSLSNSALGDSVFRLRTEDEQIIVEEVDPGMYFPHIGNNPRAVPDTEELAWTEQYGERLFLIRELHTPGQVKTEIHELQNTKHGERKVIGQVDVKTYNEIANKNIEELIELDIDENLIVHVPNYRLRGHKNYYGVSDFLDLKTLVYEANQRVTKIANILDKHSDPGLAVPEGVLDENGKVKKEKMGVFEIGPDGQKPEYIVWDANLEAAFKEIEKIVDFMYMVSETSPDVMGMAKGTAAESGRALKMRLLRTIAKRNRKRVYYDQAIKDIFRIAQKLSLAGYKVGDDKVIDVEDVNLAWQDGIVDDAIENNELTLSQVESGVKSKRTAIMELNGYSEEEAEDELQRIDESDFNSLQDGQRPEINQTNRETI